ncbi:MAG: hypothetical protein J6A44_00160 [Paludibacteraceae bacterium]|nr:hypothetical protein [Paludibacteraceae bacterium]
MRKTISFTRGIHNLCRLCVLLLSFCLISPTVFSQYEKLPYFEGFEKENGWKLNVGPNGNGVNNKWHISNIEAFMGDKALCISDDGKKLSYTNQAVCVVAHKNIHLPIGKYDLSFVWKCEGEVNADGFYVCWVPEGIDINTSLNGEPNVLKYYKLKFDDTELLQGEKNWKTSVVTIEQSLATANKLVFVWVNNSITKANGSVVIDNVQISTQNCSKPTNISVLVSGKDVDLAWNGGGHSYDLQYRIWGDTTIYNVFGVQDNMYTLKDVEFGVYDFFVRSCCDEDTSVWVDLKNVLVYDALYEGCIDYIDLRGYGVECVTGEHQPGGSFTASGKFIPKVVKEEFGCKNSGYNSELSHHTIHYMPGEVDARTRGGLRTVPEGAFASVRLGNWLGGYAEGFGRGGFESITYTHELDSGADEILLLKYAIVIEDPGHEPRTDQPVFMLELLDENDKPLSADGCGDANFVANTKLLLSGNDSTWHVEEQNVNVPILWKDWTSVGINLTDYAKNGPVKIKVRLSTYDCALGEHFGYAYFTLQCLQATIKSSSCGDKTAEDIKAPDGFDYRWYRKSDGKTACKTQKLQILDKNDSVYVCKMMFKQDSTCYLEREVNIMPRYPKPQFFTRWTPQNCEINRMEFINTSCVSTSRGATAEKCESHKWYLKDGENWVLVHDNEKLWTYDFPEEGGNFTIKLVTGINGDDCVDEAIIEVNVPKLGPVADTLSVTICEGESYKQRYRESGIFELYSGLSSVSGCDSVSYLDLTVAPMERDTIYAYICGGEEYDLNGQFFAKTGEFHGVNEGLVADGVCGDTLVTLYLSVLDVSVDEMMTICSGDSLIIDYEVNDGEFLSYQIVFDDDAKLAGFKDTEKLPLPENGRIALGHNDISDEREEINPIRPGYYTMSVMFYYVGDAEEVSYCEHVIDLTVLYSAETMEQKFDNMITLLDSTTNGGFDFDYYRWYRNGELICEGRDSSFLYLEGQNLNPTDVFTVGLTREGEEDEVLSCGMTFKLGTSLDNLETTKIKLNQNIVSLGSTVMIMGEGECNIRWWSVTGILLKEEFVVMGERLTTPQMSGFYLLEIETDACRMLERVIVK